MRFQIAGFRPAALWSAMALAFVLPAGVLMAQAQAQMIPAAAQSAAAPATAGSAAAPAVAAASGMAAKPGDATAGQGKAAVCGACHGVDGNSTDAQYPKLAGQSEEYIALQLADFKSGVRQNPIMMGMAAPLSEQDMRDLGAYFATQKAIPGVADEALVAHGQTLFREGDAARGIPACMACHSPDGRGNPGAMYPHLAGQHAQYVEATLKAWHDGTVWGTSVHAQIMPTIAKKLDAQDIAALSSYIEGLHTNEPAGTTLP
jgi:cytochrome c553